MAAKRTSRIGWERAYRRNRLLSDAAAGVSAAVAGCVIHPGVDRLPQAYATIGVAMPVVWLGALALAGSYDSRRRLDDRDAWRGIAESVGLLLAAVACAAWAAEVPVPRDYVLLLVGLAAAPRPGF